jgi:hypothetical protein
MKDVTSVALVLALLACRGEAQPRKGADMDVRCHGVNACAAGRACDGGTTSSTREVLELPLERCRALGGTPR